MSQTSENGNEEPPAGTKSAHADLLSIAVAKWLVPSITVLFVILGYVSQSAQEGLLGFGTDGTDSGDYVNSAADFCGGIISNLAKGFLLLMSGHGLPLGGHFAELVVLTLLAAGAIVLASNPKPHWKRSRAIPKIWYGAIVPALLILIILLKFFVSDAPLARLQNVVLDLGEAVATTSGRGETRNFTERVSQQRDFVGQETRRLWGDLVCSRVGPHKPNPADRFHCRLGRAESTNDLSGQFIAQLWFAALIAALSIATLRSSFGTLFSSVIAVVSLAYLLTVPYAYGKLMKSTYFDYGLVKLAHDLTQADRISNSDGVFALVLSRNAASTNLLRALTDECMGAPGQSTKIKKSSLSPSQVLSIEQIYREDVITWTALNARACDTPVCAPGDLACTKLGPQGGS
jgi:hypothetical protein